MDSPVKYHEPEPTTKMYSIFGELSKYTWYW